MDCSKGRHQCAGAGPSRWSSSRSAAHRSDHLSQAPGAFPHPRKHSVCPPGLPPSGRRPFSPFGGARWCYGFVALARAPDPLLGVSFTARIAPRRWRRAGVRPGCRTEPRRKIRQSAMPARAGPVVAADARSFAAARLNFPRLRSIVHEQSPKPRRSDTRNRGSDSLLAKSLVSGSPDHPFRSGNAKVSPRG